MHEGALFRKLRKERGLSINEVATPNLSRAFISKFERGESQISLARFKELVWQLNLSLEEFFYYQAKESQTAYTLSLKDQDYYFSAPYLAVYDPLMKMGQNASLSTADLQAYREMLAELPKEVAWGKHFKILGQALLYIEEFNQEMRGASAEVQKQFNLEEFAASYHQQGRPIISYLFSVENWGIYELILFRSSFFLMPLETLHSLLKTALARSKELEAIAGMNQLQMDIIFGAFTAFANFKRFAWAQETLDIAESRLKDKRDFFNSTLLLFFKGWNFFIRGAKEKGQEKCQQALSIFKILQQPSYYQELLKIYEWIVQAVDHPESGAMFL